MRSRKQEHRKRIELLQGTLDMLILQALQWGPMHGYGIAQRIRSKSCEVLQVETRSLYPGLHRLERQGWVIAKWKLTESKQRAKFYRITAKGKEQLASDHGQWQQIVQAIKSVMKPEEGMA